MSANAEKIPDATNAWRLDTPGAKGWGRSVRPGAQDKYFILSVDSHLGPPPTLFRDRIEKKYLDRLPRVETIDGHTEEAAAGDVILVPAGSSFDIGNPTDEPVTAWVTTSVGFAGIMPDGSWFTPPWTR